MSHRFRLLLICSACLSIAVTARAQDAAAGAAFPPAAPESVGIPARALDLLGARIDEMVRNEEIVGGELLIIKKRRTVLRKAWGWKDRDAQQKLEVDALYCVRSMTKPFVGTAIQMLLDEGRLRLDTPVHEILPYFDTDKTRTMTVEHLLTHTGGFPFTTLKRPLAEYGTLDEVAREAVGVGPGFAPGSRFEYSDAGSDTLGAIVAKLTGQPAETFIRQRILDPLGMRNTHTLLGDDKALAGRVPSAYSGGTGSWTRHWQSGDAPLFPLFLTSQSLYSTTEDYARFLAFWMDDGQVGGKRLLSPAAVARALAPRNLINNYPQPSGDLRIYYGQQWMVYARDTDGGEPVRVLFGHGGSDGTHAWAWPDEDLMVLFFTQSRGTLGGVGLERVLQTVLVDQKLDDPSLLVHEPSAAELEQVAGLYWDETAASSYYVVTPTGNRLSVARPGTFQLVFKPSGRPGRFVSEVSDEGWIEFVRAGDGSVTAMRTHFGSQIEVDPRHVPPTDVPSVDEIIARVRRAHGFDALAGLGGVRLTGTLTMEARGMEGTVVTLMDTARVRTEVKLGLANELILMDDKRVRSYSNTTGATEWDGARREQALLDRFTALYGDWRKDYRQLEVLKRRKGDGGDTLLVRAVPHEAPGITFFVDEATGRVRGSDALVSVPGAGVIGVRKMYGDYREVDGLLIPFRAEATFATPLIGTIVTVLEEVETGVELTDESFAPPY